MGANRPITQEDLDQIKALHAAGKNRNEIARAIGRSASAVSKHAAIMELTFDREATVAATAAKVADAKERRAQLQLDLLARADELLKRFDQPVVAFSFGGKENTYNEHEIDEPTFADKHKIVMAVSTAVTASIKIDEHDKASGIDEQKAALTELMGTLKHAWAAANEAPPADGPAT